jgi:hypothetical protein
MNDSLDTQLRQQLVKHLEGGEAFVPIDDIVGKMPFEKLGIIPYNLPYSFWQQFYHLRYAQYDILDFCRNPNYTAVKWPDDYWPDELAPKNRQEWKETIDAYFSDRAEMAELIANPANDLTKPISHGEGHTLLREVLLIIEHTAYHTGQMLVILRLLKE